MKNLDEKIAAETKTMICPKGHHVPYTSGNYARDFSGKEYDAMTSQPIFESGLYCHQCARPYGLSKLQTPSNN